MTSITSYLSKMPPRELRYAGSKALREGWMLVPGNTISHKIYWAEYGNPKGEPVLFVHGGPGGGTDPTHTGFFNPDRYRVILFDQRGCGKSTPNVSQDITALQDNSTQQLVADMIQLRKELDITGKMHVFGGSWGSTLSLAFAIAHPEVVASLVLRGIFLLRRKDLDYFYQGNAATYHLNPFDTTLAGAYQFFPEAWKRYVEVIPVEKRGDMVKAYSEIFLQPTTSEDVVKQQDAAAVTWSVWEGVTSYLASDVSTLDRFADPEFAKAFAKIENHYFMNGGFFGDRDQNYLIENVARIAHLPIHVVQGRFDIVCPMFQADELVKALKEHGASSLDYRVVTAGHSQFEREIAVQLVDIMDTLPPI